MALIGEFFRSAPKIPQFKPVNVQAEQGKAITGNLKSLPDAAKLAGDTNVFSQEQINKMLELAMPGYSGLRDKTTGTISSLLDGEIPSDVSDSVRRSAAARATYGGFGGTGMARNLEARDLGLTSLDLTTKGLDAASRWISSTRTAPQMDVSSMFIRPETQIQAALADRDAQFQRNYVNALKNAQYSTGSRYAASEDSILEAI